MSAFGKLLRKTTEGYLVWCPGCNMAHHARVGQPSGPNWTFDGNAESPTFSPSLLVRYGDTGRLCHSFIRDGQWQFLNDSTHDLAGQTLPVPNWEKDDVFDF